MPHRNNAGTETGMNFANLIRALGASRSEPAATPVGELRQLFAALFEGGLEDLETGALLGALGGALPGAPVLLAFDAALGDNVLQLAPPRAGRDEARPVVLPAYGASREQHNLAPLLALLLQRLGVPVLVHGSLEGRGRAATAYVLRELGVMPCMTLAGAQAALDNERLAFVPTGVLAPGLAHLLSLRNRIGPCPTVRLLTGLIDPFRDGGLRIIGADSPAELDLLRELLIATGEDALLLPGTEGEAFANPQRRPRIERLHDGAAQVLFEQEVPHAGPDLPAGELSPRATAALTRSMLEAPALVPAPIAHQLACCLYAAGHAPEFNEAKAVVAVAMRSLAAA